jgi:alkylation response protein AidB-like acyl-CoA dehydrogenase
MLTLDFTSEERSLRAKVRSFLAEHLPRDWVGIWHQPEAVGVSDRIARELADEGWLTYQWPVEYGGSGGTAWEQAVIQEELFARHEPRGGQYMGVNWIGPSIMRFGTPEQKMRYLPEIAKGEVQWAQLFSEPNAGSDLAAIATRAVPQSDGAFVVTGEKVWTSYANIARRGFLLARTDAQATRHAGLSALLIDMDLPGITVREIPSAVGNHRFHSVHFDAVEVSADALLGPLHGGWSVAMASLPFERVGNARYARTTRMLGLLESVPIVANDGLSDRLNDALALGRMAELLNHAVLDIKDREETPGWEASAAFACNALYEKEAARIIEDATGFLCLVSVEDPHALHDGELESFTARQAPTVMIQAGTYQIQLSVIAREALGLPRAR